MCHRIDLERIWLLASHQAKLRLDQYLGPLGRVYVELNWHRITAGCPIGIEDIVDDDFQFRILVERIQTRIPSGDSD